MLLVRLFSVFWRICCLCGLAAVFTWKISTYLRYPTSSKTYFHTPPVLDIPKVSLCFSLQALFSNTSKYFFQRSDSSPLFLNKTIKELFDRTPEANGSLITCAHRDRNLNTLIHRNASECAKIFQIQKYRLQGYMCYKFELLSSNSTFHLFGVSYGLRDPNVIYQLSLSRKLSLGYIMCPLIHENGYPVEDRNFNQEILPSRSKPQTYELSYDLMKVKRLKAPYDTDCSGMSNSECIMSCTKKIYEKYGLARSYDISLEDEGNLILPGYANIYKGKKLVEVMSEARAFCGENCWRPKCDYKLTRTFVSQPYNNKFYRSLSFSIKNIAHPLLVIEFDVKILITDFITELANLSAIFLSFSFLGLTIFSTECAKKRKFFDKFNQIIYNVNLVSLTSRSLTFKNIIALHGDIDEKKENFSKSSKFAMRCIILLCSFYQIFNLCNNYFRFNTVITMDFDFNPLIDPYPNLVICFKADELLSNRSHQTVDRTNYDEIYTRKAISLNFTLKELMERTPRPLDVLGGCRFRPPQNQYPAMQYFNRSQCERYFTFDKFYWKSKFCYTFSATRAEYTAKKLDSNYLRQQFLKALVVHSGMLFTVIMNNRFLPLQVISVGLYPGDSNFEPTSFTTGLYLKKDQPVLALLSYHLLNVDLLSRPYQTDCNIPGKKFTFCLNQCFSSHALEFNRLSSNGMWNGSEEHANLKIVSYLDTRNKTYYLQVVENYHHCHQACRPCTLLHSITYLRAIDKSAEKLEFAVNCHANPVWNLKAVPEVETYKLLFDLFCCLNFWYGFSFVNIDPARYLIKKIRSTSLVVERFFLIKNFTRGMMHKINHVHQRIFSNASCKSKLISRRMSKCLNRRTILIFSILVPCLVHLQDEINDYLLYPTSMYLRTEFEEVGNDQYEMAICLDMHELISARRRSPLAADQFSLQGIKLNEMFAETPEGHELMTACGFRGLNGVTLSEAVTDQFFFEVHNITECFKIFKFKKYLLKSFVCYQFYPISNETAPQIINLMAKGTASMMIALNSSLLTQRLMVTVAEPNEYPLVGSVWAMDLQLKSTPHWYSISYLKYIQYTLPWYYSLGGFSDVVYGKCYTKCLNIGLQKLNFLYHSLHNKSSNYTLLTAQDRQKPEILKNYLRIRKHCRTDCSDSDTYVYQEKFEYLTTDISQMGNQSYLQIKNSQAFYLFPTEYPVTIVRFQPAITLLQLLIALGSIIAIWFGLSVSSLYLLLIRDESHQDKDVSLDKLNTLDNQLNEMLGKLRHLETALARKKRVRRSRICPQCHMHFS